MREQITIKEKTVSYSVKKSGRARYVRLEIDARGLVAVLPKKISRQTLLDFMLKKSDWILRNLKKHQIHKPIFLKINKKNLTNDKQRAYNLVVGRINFYNQFYKFKFNKITIKNLKSRWGSCSESGNLNFNYKIVFLPAILADYIIVHELCHLGELNHSRLFWGLVAKTIPNHKILRKQLKRFVC